MNNFFIYINKKHSVNFCFFFRGYRFVCLCDACRSADLMLFEHSGSRTDYLQQSIDTKQYPILHSLESWRSIPLPPIPLYLGVWERLLYPRCPKCSPPQQFHSCPFLNPNNPITSIQQLIDFQLLHWKWIANVRDISLNLDSINCTSPLLMHVPCHCGSSSLENCLIIAGHTIGLDNRCYKCLSLFDPLIDPLNTNLDILQQQQQQQELTIQFKFGQTSSQLFQTIYESVQVNLMNFICISIDVFSFRNYGIVLNH